MGHWVGPFAITGAATLETSDGGNLDKFRSRSTGQLGLMTTRNVDILHWGFSIQYST
jgi:hypothetical protein